MASLSSCCICRLLPLMKLKAPQNIRQSRGPLLVSPCLSQSRVWFEQACSRFPCLHNNWLIFLRWGLSLLKIPVDLWKWNEGRAFFSPHLSLLLWSSTKYSVSICWVKAKWLAVKKLVGELELMPIYLSMNSHGAQTHYPFHKKGLYPDTEIALAITGCCHKSENDALLCWKSYLYSLSLLHLFKSL